MLFHISCLLFSIAFISLYIIFCTYHYLNQGSRWPLSKKFIKKSCPDSILKCSYEYLLVGMENLDWLGARVIHEKILKVFEKPPSPPQRKIKTTHVTTINMIDLSVRKDWILEDDELCSLPGTKLKALILVLDINFEVIQHDETPTISLCIKADFPTVVRKGLIECLKTNVTFL